MNADRLILKPFLAIVLAFSFIAAVQVDPADARHKKRGAIVAGAIIGGAIVYHHYKKRKAYRHHRAYHGKRYYSHKHRAYRYGYYKPYGKVYLHRQHRNDSSYNRR